MNDLLKDSSTPDKYKSISEGDIELGIPSKNTRSDYAMEDFFEQVKVVDDFLEKLADSLMKLQTANEETKSVTKASAMRVIRRRMHKEMDEVGKIAGAVKLKLAEIDQDNLANRKKPGCEKGTAVDRSRMSMTVSLKRKLKDCLNDFQNLRKTIQDEYREVVERRVFTVTGIIPTEETIDRLIETGDSEQIFQKSINEMGRGQVIDTLEEIQERRDAVTEIEKKLLELQKVFSDMAILVEAQGELLDNIETQVANAVNHVQSGTEALQVARSLQKKSRKCMIISIILLLIIAAIIILTVIKPWK